VRLAIDDFGTGYSSLSLLKRFPIHKLKIDQSFVRDLGEDASDRALVSAIVRMAQALGITTGEGVETVQQLAFLLEQGCTEALGYFYARPMPGDALPGWLHAHPQAAGKEPVT
jgi:EAL domain-containing protein (putative c-di-GMP-specific phosphodiesterase class I)